MSTDPDDRTTAGTLARLVDALRGELRAVRAALNLSRERAEHAEADLAEARAELDALRCVNEALREQIVHHLEVVASKCRGEPTESAANPG